MKNKRSVIIITCIGALLVSYLAVLLSPAFFSAGNKLQHISDAINNPFIITFTDNTLKTVLIFLLLYAFAVAVAVSSQNNKRPGEEHGSAKWGDAASLNGKLFGTGKQTLMMTAHVAISMTKRAVHKHRLNLNQLVIGGSGSGKTLFYVTPNILQANCSYVILDPKGESLYRTGSFLKSKGYKIKVLDLIHMDISHGYNPFAYIQKESPESDIQQIVTAIFAAMAPKNGAQQMDPYWDNMASMLLKALMLYLYEEAPPYEQNFAMVNQLLREAKVSEGNEDELSVVDELFEELRYKNPDSIALYYYDQYRDGAAKTLKSIKSTLISKIEKFIIPSVEKLTAYDELELEKMGEEKTALFCIIPDNDSSFNFLVSILYTQMFLQLFKVADDKYNHEALPIHVQFLMDEFANVALPEDFQKVLSTCRSRGIGISIIIQNVAQLKKLFEKDWESILGLCDETLYLGGNEPGTFELLSKIIGKETINTNTYGRNKGRNGSFTTNDQKAGRELLTPDEVRMLPNDKALLLIRGQRPIKDNKIDTFHHKNISKTPLCGGTPYEHGILLNAVQPIPVKDITLFDLNNIEVMSDIQ